jgi:uncharacterized membrane protein
MPLRHAALALFAAGLLAAGCYFVGVEGVLALAVGLAVTLACIRRFDAAFSHFLGLSMGVSYEVLLSFRPTLGQATLLINPLDFLMALSIAAILLNLIGRREDLGLPRYVQTPYLIYAAMTLFAVIYGIVANGGTYTYFKDLRIFFMFHLTFIGVAWFIRTPAQLRRLATVLVIAGVVCATQQVGRLILGAALGLTSIRDVELPTQVLPMAIMFLMIYRYHGLRLVPRNATLFLIGFMLFAALISLTRGVWASVVLSYLLGIRYMGAKQRARTILITGALIGLIVFVIPSVVNITMNGWSIESLIQDRVQLLTSNSQYDLARQSRLLSSYYAWMEFIKSPVWGLGVGYPIFVYDLHSRMMIEDLGLHNSALYYGVKVGGIGLLALIAVIVGALRRASRVAGAEPINETPDQKEVRAFAQALLASVIPFTLIGPWSANLNYFPFMSLLGLYTGLNWDRLVARTRVVSTPERILVEAQYAGSAE